MSVVVTEEDLKTAHAIVDKWWNSNSALFGEAGDTSLAGRISQAIADAREREQANWKKWIYETFGPMGLLK